MDADAYVPAVFFHKYQDDPIELKKREDAIATSAEHSYYYAVSVIKRRWPPGEPVIATSAEYSYIHAREIVKGPWPLGEPAIMKNVGYSRLYDDFLNNK